MEDILDVYQRPGDPERPLVCVDETSKQLIAETRVPIAAKPGQPARHDYEYRRNGTANLFMMFAPLEGWRHVKVTDRHTALDYAQVLKELSDTHFPGAKKEAKAFFGVYGGLVALAAALVLRPGMPLGLLTNAVQTLAGVLLPSATVFLLLLCNDHAVLGPWINGRWLNVFTGAVIATLVMLSIILTASVLYPEMGETAILAILGGGTLFTVAIGAALLVIRRDDRSTWTDSFGRMIWRMPPLDQLLPAHMTPLTRIWLAVLRGYLIVAGGLVLWRIVDLAMAGG